MKRFRLFCAALLAACFVPTLDAQAPATPGPEHAELKKMEGVWDATMKMAGMESKCKATFKSTLGDLWLASDFEGEVAGQKFTGKGFDTYDAGKKKYVSIWMDSMSTSPMVLEGTMDKATKTLTMTGEGPGHDGKPTKHKTVSTMPDENTMNFAMYMGDTKEPMFTITYKRKK